MQLSPQANPALQTLQQACAGRLVGKNTAGSVGGSVEKSRGVRVGAFVRVGALVRVTVGVKVSVRVRVGWRVSVGVRVGRGVRVTVGVRVGRAVRVTALPAGAACTLAVSSNTPPARAASNQIIRFIVHDLSAVGRHGCPPPSGLWRYLAIAWILAWVVLICPLRLERLITAIPPAKIDATPNTPRSSASNPPNTKIASPKHSSASRR
jgi:hypothetical protein